MYCWNCGEKVKDLETICNHCKSPVRKAPSKNRGWMYAFIVLLIIYIATFVIVGIGLERYYRQAHSDGWVEGYFAREYNRPAYSYSSPIEIPEFDLWELLKDEL